MELERDTTTPSEPSDLQYTGMRWRRRREVLIALATLSVVVVVLAVGLSFGLAKSQYVFKQHAVASDSKTCSQIGTGILERKGSAVDAAIGTLVCVGLFAPHSMGIGGGHFMTIYDSGKQKAVVINARGVAPLAATRDMYHGSPKSYEKNITSMAVPGEIKGYWEAHQLYGKLPWNELFTESIQLARKGITVENALAKALISAQEFVENDRRGLRQIFFNEATGQVLRENDTYTNPQLADTLEAIAKLGGQEFYTGNIAKKLVKDLEALGGIITQEDLESYRAQVTDALSIDLRGGVRVFSVPPPGSGAVLALALLILDGYGLNSSSVANDQSSALTYHRIVESFKFAYAERTYLGDPLFVDVSKHVASMTSKEYADLIRKQIDDDTTHPASYYGGNFADEEDHGTSHVSVLARNGDAVSVTSTVNLYFGCSIRSLSTGIILNDEMDDFSSPNTRNHYGLPASKYNYIEPGKRPISSITSSVFVDTLHDHKVVLVVGAAGGTRITTATALTAIRYLWLHEPLDKSVNDLRVHHQLFPYHVFHETNFPRPILDGLRRRNHTVKRNDVETRAIVNAISVNNDGTLHAVADWRKSGGVSVV